MCGLLVNLPQLVFNNISADNFEHRNLPYGMVLAIFFYYWGVNLSEEACIAPSRPFDHSFITRMMSHLFHSHQDSTLDEEEIIHASEPPHTTSPPILLTDPYSTLFTSIHNLSLSYTQLRNDFYSTVTHFAASLRLVEMHLAHIQNHLGYHMPPPTQYMHPLPPTDPPFPPYDPWPTPGPATTSAGGDYLNCGDATTTGAGHFGTF